MVATNSQPGELQQLLIALTDGEINECQFDRLQELLAQDPAAQVYYRRYMRLCALLEFDRAQAVREEEDEEDFGYGIQDLGVSLQPSPIPPIVTDPSPALRWPIGSFVFSHVAAALILGVGLLIGLVWRISLPSPELPDSDYKNYARLVGHITALADCAWSKQGVEVRGPGSGISGIQIPKSPNPQIPVFLGDRFFVASGLMQITYDTGAKVLLEGPCTYEIESDRGGFLALGKLTAKVEKGSGIRGPGSGNANHSPLSSLPSPLFAVRTPMAVVTDLGTEFGVEVEKSGTTRSHVFQGSVELRASNSRRATTSGEGESVEILHAGQSACVKRGRNSKVAIILEQGQPGKFVRHIPASINAPHSSIGQGAVGSDDLRRRARPMPPSYRLIDLGTLGGKTGRACYLNAAGQVVGWAENADGWKRAFRYLQEKGKMEDLGLPADVGSEALGVNSHGHIVGWSDDYCREQGRAFLFSDGAIRDLGTLGGTTACATAINDAGQIVGLSANSDGIPRAFLYTHRDGMKDIGSLYGPKSESCAHGITEAGVVAGQARAPNGRLHAFLYSNAMGIKEIHGKAEGGTSGQGINELCQVIGTHSIGPNWKQFAFFYDPKAGVKTLGRHSGLFSEATDINNHGQIVGWVSRDYNDFRAALWQNGEVTDLNELIDPAADWKITLASAINDAGQIAAQATAPDGTERPVLLVPVKQHGARD